MCYIVSFYHTVSDWNFQHKTSCENLESHKTNVFWWPPRNILKGNKSNKLPGLVDAHGRGHMVAIIKPVKRFVSSFGPDEIFESDEGEEEGHFSFVD